MSKEKQLVAKELTKRIKDGEVIGLGSGSTCELAIKEIGKKIKAEGIKVYGVPTSKKIANLAKEVGIEILPVSTTKEIVWAFDGADEVDPEFNMIKGRGGAMLLEKIVAKKANSYVIIVGENKLVETLGEKFPIPIEIIAEAEVLVSNQLLSLGAVEIVLRRTSSNEIYLTDKNNLVLDVRFSKINEELEQQIKNITGVVESGLFFNLADELLVANEEKVVSRTKK